MRYLFFAVATMFLFLTACTPKTTNTFPDTKVVKLGEETELSARQTIEVEGYYCPFTFVEVINDSRCPKGANCFQAGEAEIAIRTCKNDYQTITIDADYRTAQRIVADDVVINILGLSPYPKEGKKVDYNDYKLQVSTSLIRD